MYKVYALIKDNECVYVGCTVNLKNRLKAHKQSKCFDSHIEVSNHKFKKDALAAERAIIKFLSIFGGNECLNAKYDLLSYKAEFHLGLNNNDKNY